MNKIGECTNTGTQLAEKLGRMVIGEMLEDPKLSESAFLEDFREDFKEDNTMGNSGDLYTIKLAQVIWYKSYDNFQQYFDMVWNLTPADLGYADGAGSYKIPKILGATAAKIADGEVVQYLNNNKDSVTLETETFGIGTKITRRTIKRGAKGFIQKLMQAASDSTLRAVCRDLINGMINGASSTNTVAGSISYNKVLQMRKNIKAQSNNRGEKFGFVPDYMGLTEEGERVYYSDTDVKNAIAMKQANPKSSIDELNDKYTVVQGLRLTDISLATATKNSLEVHAVVCHSDHFTAFLKETEMETFQGRLPGTAGDEEIIMAMDCGYVITNAEAGGCITA